MSRSRADDTRLHPHHPGATALRSALRRSERVKLRRALTFVGMTLLLPGSAQLAAGHGRLGRAALRVWLLVWAVLAGTALLALVWRGGAVALLTNDLTLRLVQGALVVLGLGWGLLVVDAWRLARPPELAHRHRLGFAVLNLALVFTVVGGLFASAALVSSQRDLMASVFAGGGDHEVKAGRYNVLLLGGDAGRQRVGLRPDSMTVASIDAETGRTVLVGLPRNLEGVPFPDSSPLHREFPDGFRCSDHSCMLNAVYTYASERPHLYPGVRNPGAQATLEAVEAVTGLEVNYWALIDLEGFEDLVDAVGGITMDVYRSVPIGGGTSKVTGYVEAGPDRHLTGREALWFARSRADSSDYDRMVRQKCVMNAMLDQLDPVTVLTNFNQIAAAGQEVVATSVPGSEVDTMLELALDAKRLPMASLALVPPLVDPGEPDFGAIRAAVAAKVAAAERADARAAGRSADQGDQQSRRPAAGGAGGAGGASASPEAQATAGASEGSGTAADPTAGPAQQTDARADTEDLSKVCAA